MRKIVFCSLSMAALATQTLASSPQKIPLEEMGARLVALRAEVEDIGRELEDGRRKHQSELDVQLQRKSELDLQVKKEETKALQLREKAIALRAKLSGGGQDPADRTALLQWAASLEKSIQESIPFHREDRLSRLSALKKRITENRESTVALGSELWNLTEQESKMSRENEHRVGKVVLDGKPTDAEVARIGRVQMFFVTAQGVAGKAIRENRGWNLQPAQSKDEEKSIRRIVTHFKEKQESGWFDLPGLQSIREVKEL